MRIPNKRELQQIPINHLSNIDVKDFMTIWQKCNAKPFSVLVNNTTIAIKQSFTF